MAIELVFETHSTTVDNEEGRATGWQPGGCPNRARAVARVGRFLADLPLRWEEQRILVIGHVATRWGLDHFIDGVQLEELVERDFAWQKGWEYRIN